ncbi:hypothetical protein SLUN_36715 [Streptomyces lunaelactis]|uniref:Uncharacterized protein n=1 Tax=Streptomyces lunaelactis TaxID=1535768 RepID=A0A2R4TCQ4_9ACTN|nr:hypothetical protein [Streptomyces lunaelactis]AVZ76908.1 hypothetical protein SLUN_36715 [Streptomyces lunaelactis]NUK00930.1 hypothetical protein [Streptomyces lunaelactis]NUK12761.1 hypothetical protein [Streptomyces lunaelactis]NUK13778.1 hypothetical protein [Streptomyces lunaelactis]NUK21581.1 hypothetical protein [Streptomyces lunaelactis]
MNTQPDRNQPSDGVTPDSTLHIGSEGGVTPEDVVLASGRDVTPANLAWAERKLADEGSAALDKLLP